MFSCVWLHFKIFFEKYFLVFGKEVGKEEGRGKTQKNPDKPRRTRRDLRDRRRDLGSRSTARSRVRVNRDWRERCFARDHAARSRILSLSRSPFARALFARPQFRKSFEVKIGTEMNFHGQRYYLTVN